MESTRSSQRNGNQKPANRRQATPDAGPPTHARAVGYVTPLYTRRDLAALGQIEPDAPRLTEAVDMLNREFRALFVAELPERRTALLLSGGIDSALALALLRAVGCEPVSITAGALGAPDLEHAERVARAFDTPWEPCVFAAEDVRERLPAIVPDFGAGGLLTVASGLVLDRCFARAAELGITHVWAGNGLDVLFGGGVPMQTIEVQAGHTFHERFWSYTLPLLERREDPLNLYGVMGKRYGIRVSMPFETLAAAKIARRVDAATLYRDGSDKAPVRTLAERLGVPAGLAARPKDALQRSSGMFGALRHVMIEDASRLCPDPYQPVDDDHEDPYVELRYFIALLSRAMTDRKRPGGFS